jgi:hypothetical protein
MKKIIITNLLVLIFCIASGQVVDPNKFYINHFEKVLFHEVNQYRKSIGKDTLFFSEVLYKKVSYVNVQKMGKQKILKHFDFDLDTIRNEVGIEAEKKQGGKMWTDENGVREVRFFAEICLKSNFFNYKDSVTYQQIAKHFVSIWKNSKGHNELMSLCYSSYKSEISGLGSCAVYISEHGTMYACFNFIQPFRRYGII